MEEHEANAADVESRRRASQAKAFDRVRQAYGLRRRQLADMLTPDLAGMIRHVTGVSDVSVSSLSEQLHFYLTHP